MELHVETILKIEKVRTENSFGNLPGGLWISEPSAKKALGFQCQVIHGFSKNPIKNLSHFGGDRQRMKLFKTGHGKGPLVRSP
jgi:hypothetical protein